MRNIPNFDTELSQAVEFVLGSDLAQRALIRPPFQNYTNIVIHLLQSIDCLADNCHMPEFTNHGLPHICSIVKRASEWGVSDQWIENLSPKEAGYLLIALIVHDVGMLSQDVKDIPEQERMLQMKEFSDISNWVRKTHVIRIEGLVNRLLKEYREDNSHLQVHLNIIIGMAQSHNKWPWDKSFVSFKKEIRRQHLTQERVAALNAIIAVCDLLDEDANRCDIRFVI